MFSRLYTPIFFHGVTVACSQRCLILAEKKKLSKTNILIEGIDSNTYRRNIYSIFGFNLIQSVLIRPFHFKVNLTIKWSFYMYRSWNKMVDSKQMYSGNQLLLVFTLTSFYHLHIKLVRYTSWTKAAIRRYSSK